MAKSKLLSALAREKGKVPYLEKQKKLQKEARKKKRKITMDQIEDFNNQDGILEVALPLANGSIVESKKEEKGMKEKKAECSEAASLANDDNNDEEEAEEEEDDEEEGEDNDEVEQGEAGDEEEEEEDGDEEEEEEDDDDEIPLSEISEADQDPDADVIPRQRLIIDNHPALLAAYNSIALPIKSLSFSTHQSITTSTPIEIKDVHDDLNRELAFYTQALDAAKKGRGLLLKENVPFTRPSDYFAEMVKTEEHMGKIKEKLRAEAAGKKASQEAKRQRDLKKFGKQVQVAKLEERQKQKRETLDKIQLLKRSK